MRLAIAVFPLLVLIPVFAGTDVPAYKVVSTPRPFGAGAASSGYEGIALANIVVTPSPDVDGLPCFNCILGVSSSTVGLATPLPNVDVGTTVNLPVFIDDESYNGPCGVAWFTQVAGGALQTIGGYDLPGGCLAGNTYLVEISAAMNAAGTEAVGATLAAGTIRSTVKIGLTVGPFSGGLAGTLATFMQLPSPGDNTVPCVNCVPGASVSSVGLGVLVYAFPVGLPIEALQLYTNVNSLNSDSAVETDLMIAGQDLKFGLEQLYCATGTAYFTFLVVTPPVSGAGVHFNNLYEGDGQQHTLVGHFSSPFYVEP